MTTDRNDSAFPHAEIPETNFVCFGLTFREYAAVAAMQGLLAHKGAPECTSDDYWVVAANAMGMADMLIDTLNGVETSAGRAGHD